MSADPQQPDSPAHDERVNASQSREPENTPTVHEGLTPHTSWTPAQFEPSRAGRDLLAPEAKGDENPPWNGWDILLVLALSVVALFVGGIAITLIVAAILGSKHLDPEQLNSDLRFILPIQLTMYAAAVGMMFQTIRIRYRRPFGEGIRWNWPTDRTWVWVLAGVLLAIVVQVSELIVPMPKNLPIEKFFSTPLNAYLMGILGVLIAPVVEELFFRGFLYPVLARRFGVLVGVLLTGGVFALFHAAQLGYAWTPLVIMLIVGVTLTAIRAFTKSVAASTLAHVTYNFVLMATLWIATDHFRHLERMSR